MYHWEVTDTYGGEANYAWCHQGETKTLNAASRAVRGHLPKRSRIEDKTGEALTIRPPKNGPCRVGFIYHY